MRFIEHILDTIAPYECVQCRREGDTLCNLCAATLPIVPSRCYGCQQPTRAFATCDNCHPTILGSVHPVTFYDGTAKDLVWKIKFERLSGGAKSIAARLATLDYDLDEVIVHVPTATSRVRQRGYDQARLIAKELATRTGLAHTTLLARHGQHRQVGKTKTERKAQSNNMFAATGNVANKRIVLVDDVITTGATLEACARTLQKAGAVEVRAVVFAAA